MSWAAVARDEINKLVGCQRGLFYFQMKSFLGVLSHLNYKVQKEFVFY